jgi:hypothetical protein
MSGINTAQLAIYAVFSLPVIYIPFRHGRPGLVGWVYTLGFCSLRVVGGAISLSDKNGTNTAAATISSIGLSSPTDWDLWCSS